MCLKKSQFSDLNHKQQRTPTRNLNKMNISANTISIGGRTEDCGDLALSLRWREGLQIRIGEIDNMIRAWGCLQERRIVDFGFMDQNSREIYRSGEEKKDRSIPARIRRGFVCQWTCTRWTSSSLRIARRRRATVAGNGGGGGGGGERRGNEDSPHREIGTLFFEKTGLYELRDSRE